LLFGLGLLPFGLLLSLFALVSGCGASDTGRYASVSGKVVDARNLAQGIPNARVRLEAVGVAETQANQEGNFFARVRVNEQGPTTVTITVTLPEGSPYQGVTIRIEASAGAQLDITITLVPLSGPIPANLQVIPPSASLLEGETQQFVAGVTDEHGQPITAYTPTWVVEGQIGTVTPTGRFTAGYLPEGVATRSGKVWAVLGSLSAKADVTVNKIGSTGDLGVIVR